MKRHFCRHLLCGAAVTRPSEEPADEILQLRVPEGADEKPLSSAPSGLPSPEALNARNQTTHGKSQRAVDKSFPPGLQIYISDPAEFLLTRSKDYA